MLDGPSRSRTKVKFILHKSPSSAAGLVVTTFSLYVVVAGQGTILNSFTYKKIEVGL